MGRGGRPLCTHVSAAHSDRPALEGRRRGTLAKPRSRKGTAVGAGAAPLTGMGDTLLQCGRIRAGDGVLACKRACVVRRTAPGETTKIALAPHPLRGMRRP